MNIFWIINTENKTIHFIDNNEIICNWSIKLYVNFIIIYTVYSYEVVIDFTSLEKSNKKKIFNLIKILKKKKK